MKLPVLRLFLPPLLLLFFFGLFVFRDFFLGHDVLIALGEHYRVAAPLANGGLMAGAGFVALPFGRTGVMAHVANRRGQRIRLHQQIAYFFEKIIELKRLEHVRQPLPFQDRPRLGARRLRDKEENACPNHAPFEGRRKRQLL